jgi:tetratricopeptide (TPR) repeat protein
VRLAERIEQLGALNLAAVMFQALTQIDPALPELDRGRLVIGLGRIERKLGRVDDAVRTYRQVIAKAREIDLPELEARGFLGLAAGAQIQGDFAELRKFSLQALKAAKQARVDDILPNTYQGLMIASAQFKDWSAAINYGWKMHETSGSNQSRRDEALTNIGELFSMTGNFAAARASFAVVLTRPQPARICLPALGGLAVAASKLDDHDTLNWSTTQLLREVDRTNQPFEVSGALVECGVALLAAGRFAQAAECRARAIEIAGSFGYREVLKRAEAIDLSASQHASTPTLTMDLGLRARGIVRKVEAMNPSRLPDHVLLQVAA